MLSRNASPNEYQERLEAFLAETPLDGDESILWEAAWGSEDGQPKWFQHARRLATSNSGEAMLVHGNYGTGKTSFLRQLLAQVSKLDSGGQHVRQVWLHMPVVCPGGIGSGVSAVMEAIVLEAEDWVEQLATQASGGSASHDGASLQTLRDKAADIRASMTDLWKLEAGQRLQEPGTAIEVPRANRMGPTPSLPTKIHRANTLELMIGQLLEALSGRMVIYLDDLDRCVDRVPVDVVRLLLRFGNTQRVHFVIACDRDVMEEGVRQWMLGFNSRHEDAAPVTANSALMKYLHNLIEMPSLGGRRSKYSNTEKERLLDQHYARLLTEPWDLQLARQPQPRRMTLAAVFLERMLAAMLDQRAGPDAGADSTQAEAQTTPEPAPDTQEAVRVTRASREPSADSENRGSSDGIEKSDDETPVTDPNYAKAPPLLVNALKEMVEIHEHQAKQGAPATRWLECNESVIWLFSYLTLRQFKHYLREQFSPTASEEEVERALLKTLFHPVWRLWRDDRGVFDRMRELARLAKQACPAKPDEAPRISSFEQNRFERMVRTLVEESPAMSTSEWQTCWARKKDERGLLIVLLACFGTAKRPAKRDDSFEAVKEADARLPPATPEGAARAHARPSFEPAAPAASPQVGLGQADTAEVQREFSEWAQAKLRRPMRGRTIPDLVSNFQDIVLQQSRQDDGARALQTVAEFAERWLDRLQPYFEPETATSLSNLAVMLDDEGAYIVQCDRLFEQAYRVRIRSGAESRIPMYWAEFLLDVTDQPNWPGRLVNAGRYASTDAIAERARVLLKDVERSDKNLREQVHYAVLAARADSVGKPPTSPEVMERFEKLVSDLTPQWLEAAKRGDSAPAGRLSDALRDALGTGRGSLAKRIGLMLPIWANLSRSYPEGAWTIRLSVANVLVGSSEARSMEEVAGLQLNAGLLIDPGVASSDPERIAAVWSQSAATLKRYGQATSTQGRDALLIALLASASYGVSGGWYERASDILEQLQIVPTAGSARDYLAAIRGGLSDALLGELQPLLEKRDQRSAAALVERVFSVYSIRPLVDYDAFMEQYPTIASGGSS